MRLAVIAGVFGVTFVVAFVAALLAEAASGGRPLGVRLGFVGLAAAATFAPFLIPFARPVGRAIDVATIQVDFREGVRQRSREEGDIAVTRLNLDLHRTLKDEPPDLAVWGEGALDPGSLDILDEVRATVADVGVPVLAGSTSADIRAAGRRNVALFNQAVVFDGGGEVLDVYRKTHLVPFGEYIPWNPLVGWISALEQIGYELTPGERLHTLSAPGLPRFAAPICFENSFPALDRELVRQGAGFLVVLTNNASYDETAASAQHLQMSRIRAIEDGRWVVNAAVSGISAFIDPSGRTYQQTELFGPPLSGGRSAHRRIERYPFVWVTGSPSLSLASVVCLAAVPRGRRRPRPDPEPLGADDRTLVILPTFDEARTIREVSRACLRIRGSTPSSWTTLRPTAPEGSSGS